MNLILVSVINFQSYILDNIQQLLNLNIKNIYVITNKHFFCNFEKFSNQINLIDVDELTESYNYATASSLNRKYRSGFWVWTSLRFFYIYALIKKYDLIDCVHIENDVLLYYNIDLLHDKLDKKYMYMPFDSLTRNIASIVYIPNSDVLKTVLDNYDNGKNDMNNFIKIKKATGLIQNFPIFPNIYATTRAEKFVSENFENFNFVFDAAAIGQFLGGVDPNIKSYDTSGYINVACIIRYNKYKIIWEFDNNIKKPFLLINDINYPIFNLHIHSKNLLKFM